MNVLPLVFALLLILSVVTIEKFDQFKNAIIVQNEYKFAIEKQDRRVYNKREAAMNQNKNEKVNYRQLTFRPFFDKKLRDPKHIEKYRQYRQLTVDLIRILYGHAAFFKQMEQQRPQLIDELLDAIQEASDKMPDGSLKRIQDISKINLEDEDLQFVYYRMLKGTIDKDDFKELVTECKKQDIPIPLNFEKTYFPLLLFVNNNGTDGNYSSAIINVALAPRELLLAIYGNPEVVEELIQRRCELSVKKDKDKSDLNAQFRTEFEGKQKTGIVDVLKYEISSTDKSNRD